MNEQTHFALPEPLYPLKRYNSKVLLSWLEQSEAVTVQMVELYNRKNKAGKPILRDYIELQKSATLRDVIYDTLVQRGLDEGYLNRVLQLVHEDIRA